MDPNIQGSFLFNNGLNQFPTDLKAPVCQYSVPNSFYKLNPGLNSQLPPGTPHGISDILSRSMMGMGSAGTTTTLLSGYSTMSGFGPSVTSTSVYYNRDYNSNLGGFSKPGAECAMKSRGVSCWAESSCDWRGARQQCSNSESASTDITPSQSLCQSTRKSGIEETHLDNRKIFDAEALLENIIHPFDFVCVLITALGAGAQSCRFVANVGYTCDKLEKT